MDVDTLHENGYFVRNGRRIVPVGVNYWPATSGVEMWARWDADEIRHDLDVVAGLGLNAIRFFLRWQDFEPREGQYAESSFHHLEQLMEWIAERGLLAQPTLFVGGMSGGTFWPDWKRERSLFADSEMIERSRAFARKAALRIAPHRQVVAGFDFGNEMEGLPDSKAASLAQLSRWCHAVREGVRAEIPDALFVAGTSNAPLVCETPWRYDNDLGTDFLSVHLYPIPHWQGVRFDGLRDPFAQRFLPFTVHAARTFGPVMVQEFGTLITGAAAPQEAYLRAILPDLWNAGANGFLWWCLRDITARTYNYVRSPMEALLGLVDAHDRVKPGLEPFLEFARWVQQQPDPDLRRETALYWPRHSHQQDNPAHTGNEPRTVNNRLRCAHHALRGAGVDAGIVRGGRPVPGHVRTLVIAGAHLDADETAALADWVEAGGRLIWHGPRWNEWGPDAIRLLGARPADFRLPRSFTVQAFGRSWSFAAHHTPENCRLELAPEGARPLHADTEGFPVVWRHDHGHGTVLFSLPVVEEAILNDLSNPVSRDAWAGWYAGELAELDRHPCG